MKFYAPIDRSTDERIDSLLLKIEKKAEHAAEFGGCEEAKRKMSGHLFG